MFSLCMHALVTEEVAILMINTRFKYVDGPEGLIFHVVLTIACNYHINFPISSIYMYFLKTYGHGPATIDCFQHKRYRGSRAL